MKASELPRSIGGARRLLDSGEISSEELTRAFLERIYGLEPTLHAFVIVAEELALASAKRADRKIREGDVSPVTGIPLAVKDVIITRGLRTTCSSRMLENYIPPYNATVMDRLESAGAVIVGKTNMDEFAMGSSTENSAFFPTRNPYDLERVPGGSSGGSAVTVSGGEAVYALGSDTGGSIRQPAGFCNVVGLKPTYGRVSRYGLVAFASSLDQIGPITTTVRDGAVLLGIIAGHDDKDSTSSREPVADYTRDLERGVKGLRIGVPREYLAQGTAPEVSRVMEGAIDKLSELGASVEEMSLPHTRYALAAYYIIAPAEASANLARYNGVKYGFSAGEGANALEAMALTRGRGFGDEVKRRIMLGTYALSAGYYDAWYVKALKVRAVIRREFEEAFSRYDVLVTPTSPTLPFRIGERVKSPYQMYLADVCTLPVSIAGLPAVSVPGGFAHELPVGLQIIGRPFDEVGVLRVASAYERATEWYRRTPPTTTC